MDESTKLSYLQWQEKYLAEKPYQVFVPLPVGVPEENASNLVFDLGDEEVIRDIRGSSTSFSLDEHGFTTCSMEMSPHSFSEMEITNDYIPKTCELVKEAVNAELVVPFDWRVGRATTRDFLISYNNTFEQIRKSTSPIKAKVINLEEQMIPLLPATHVHIGIGLLPLKPYTLLIMYPDQTPVSVKQRVKLHAPEELHRFQTGRVQIIK